MAEKRNKAKIRTIPSEQWTFFRQHPAKEDPALLFAPANHTFYFGWRPHPRTDPLGMVIYRLKEHENGTLRFVEDWKAGLPAVFSPVYAFRLGNIPGEPGRKWRLVLNADGVVYRVTKDWQLVVEDTPVAAVNSFHMARVQINKRNQKHFRWHPSSRSLIPVKEKPVR